MAAVAKLIPNLFAAHTRACAVIKRYNPGAMVGSNPWIFGLPAWLQKLIDRNATQIHGLRDLLKQAPCIGAWSG